MGLDNESAARLAKLQECQSAEDVMALLAEEGVELNDEQLEAVAGGLSGMSFEDLLTTFGDAVASLFPEGYDPAQLWRNLPMAGH